MNRNTFIESEWKKYPEAPSGALSVAEFVQVQPEGCMGDGRLGQDFRNLYWQDHRLDLDKSNHQESMDIDGLQAVDRALLAEGDLVVVRIRKDSGDQSRLIHSSFVLLAPRMGPRIQSEVNKQTLIKWSVFLTQIRGFLIGDSILKFRHPL